MRYMRMMAAAAMAVASMTAAGAEDAFDACDLFTIDEARKVLGANAEAEPVNPKARTTRSMSTPTIQLNSRGGL